MKNKFHPFHMISLSPWPIVSSFMFLITTLFMVIFFNMKNISSLLILLAFFTIISYEWWMNVVKESLNQGYHQLLVMMGLKLGMILFITSEILFFVSFFWGYFHSAVSPITELGQIWPPLYINSFNPMNVPLLNTIILLSSGVSITWAHHLLLEKKFFLMNLLMLITCFLGFYFSVLQGMEYIQASFSIGDSIYGSIFFMSTGFHGLHVLIGTSFLIITMIRMFKIHLNNNHLIGFELAAWYWHFVDVVWLYLYTSVYWWGH